MIPFLFLVYFTRVSTPAKVTSWRLLSLFSESRGCSIFFECMREGFEQIQHRIFHLFLSVKVALSVKLSIDGNVFLAGNSKYEVLDAAFYHRCASR